MPGFNNTATLTIGPDTVNFGSSGDNAIYAADATLSAGDMIDAGSGGGNTLFLTSAGTFDLTLPTTLTNIQTVTGDLTDDQTILLRAGLPVTVNLGGGADIVTIANTGDVVRGGTGSDTVNATTGLLTATLDGGSGGFGQLNISDGSATSATFGGNITNFHYVNLLTSGFTLDLGTLDAPVTYITGDGTVPSGDAVTMRFADQDVIDYTGGNTIAFAGGTETLTQEYIADGASQPTDTLLDFDSTDTIALPSLDFNDPNLTIGVNFDSSTDVLALNIFDDITMVSTTQDFQLSGLFVGGGFSAQSDGGTGTTITYSGAVFNPPANPPPTQTVYWVPPAGTDGGTLIASDGTGAGTAPLFPRAATLQGFGFTTSNNSGSDRTDTVAGGKLYLLEQGLPGTALYVSDGTTAGTTLLRDLGTEQQLADNSLGAAGPSDLGFLTVQHTGTVADALSGTLDASYTVTLWTSDGSAAGTSSLMSFASTDGAAPPVAAYEGTAAGQYFFAVSVGAGDDQLWATNTAGTAASEIADLGAGQPTDFQTVAGGGLYWSDNGELFHSNGTASGTAPVLGTNAPTTGSLVVDRVLGTFDSGAVVAFSYYGTGNQVHLGNYDGHTLADLGVFDFSSVELGEDSAVQVGSNIVFAATDTSTLYVSDGSSPLTAVTPNGLPAGASVDVPGLAAPGASAMLGGLLYFVGNVFASGTSYAALFDTDGTAGNTNLVDDLQQQSGSLTQLTAAGNVLYFVANISGSNYVLRSDGVHPAYPVGTGDAYFDIGGLITGPLTPDNPAPTPGNYTLTTGPDTLIGTPYNDTFTATSGTLSAGDVIVGNGGLDRLVLSGNGTFDLSAPATLSGISEVDAQVGGVSGSTQTITLRAGTAMTVRVSGSDVAYTVNGAVNNDSIIGSSGETFSGSYTTTVNVGGTGETIDVANAIVRTGSTDAGALVIGPSVLTLTDAAAPIVLNAGDQLPAVQLAGATNLTVSGGTFAFDNFLTVRESVGGNTIALGDNGRFTIDSAGSGHDVIDAAGSMAQYNLIGTTAELQGDSVDNIDTSGLVDSIDITDLSFATATRSYSGGVLTVTDGSHTDRFTIPVAGATTNSFHLGEDFGGGTVITVMCFAAGTRIASPAGDVEVEALRAGDAVLTADGVARPVRWVGRRRIDVARHPRPSLVQPIRIRAGAVAGGLPTRDLLVSPDHAVLAGGALVPARLLVNGVSIVRATDLASVEYFHVELDRHELLLAEGLAAESYRDTGNRAAFENSGAAVTLHPDFSTSPLELSLAPAVVEQVWQRLAERAKAVTGGEPTTHDAELRVLAGARRLAAVENVGTRHVFALPPGACDVRLVSHAASPAEAAPWHDDRRRLGVCVARIVLDGARELALDDPALDGAFWPLERDGARSWRWTDGDAPLRVPPGTRLLAVELAGAMRYPVARRAA